MNAIVIGGGFYGCMVALHLHEKGIPVSIIEASDNLLSRASYVNQARVHNGYHYPRSFNTAYRSRFNSPRFIREFKPAVVDNFTHLYAIVRARSKVTAKQFTTFAHNIEAKIKPARKLHQEWFNPRLIESVFEVEEFAFDATILKEILLERLGEDKIPIHYNEKVLRFTEGKVITDKNEYPATLVFNCTYSALEDIAGTAPLKLKHEITEIALVKVPPLLSQIGITVMDGPFFSVMPFPAESLHSFTHVRYTPHASWKSGERATPYGQLDEYQRQSRFPFMVRDAARFMPMLKDSEYQHSHFEVKTVMQTNEVDDGRPILFQQQPGQSVYSILGSKIDNIYDVLERIDAVLVNA